MASVAPEPPFALTDAIMGVVYTVIAMSARNNIIFFFIGVPSRWIKEDG